MRIRNLEDAIKVGWPHLIQEKAEDIIDRAVNDARKNVKAQYDSAYPYGLTSKGRVIARFRTQKDLKIARLSLAMNYDDLQEVKFPREKE